MISAYIKFVVCCATLFALSARADELNGDKYFSFNAQGRGGRIYVPASQKRFSHPPAILMLHGMGSDLNQSYRIMKDECQRRGIILITPESQGITWDFRSKNSLDKITIEQILRRLTFFVPNVDLHKFAVAGFSNGATNAIYLGTTMTGRFSHVIGYSPRYLPILDESEKPKVFLTHGLTDPVINYSNSDHIAEELRSEGYSVEYQNFQGNHLVPQYNVKQSLDWFLSPK